MSEIYWDITNQTISLVPNDPNDYVYLAGSPDKLLTLFLSVEAGGGTYQIPGGNENYKIEIGIRKYDNSINNELLPFISIRPTEFPIEFTEFGGSLENINFTVEETFFEDNNIGIGDGFRFELNVYEEQSSVDVLQKVFYTGDLTKTSTDPGTNTASEFNLILEDEANVECFSEYTNVLTPSGYKNITTLQKGDLVVTVDGREVPIVKLYVKTQPIFERYPYCIPKDHYGINKPMQDILISENHPFFTGKKWTSPKKEKLEKELKNKTITWYNIKLNSTFTDFIICDGLKMFTYGKKYLSIHKLNKEIQKKQQLKKQQLKKQQLKKQQLKKQQLKKQQLKKQQLKKQQLKKQQLKKQQLKKQQLKKQQLKKKTTEK